MAGLDTIAESGTGFNDAEGSVSPPQKIAHRSGHPLHRKEASAPKPNMEVAEGPVSIS